MSELMTQKYFDARPRSVSLARKFTTATLASWGLDGLTDDVRLCVSELATNALVHGTEPGRGFLVKLAHDDTVLRLEVHDSRSLRRDSHRPRVHDPDPADASGRGLLLVQLLADAWGVESRQPFGKIVWSRFKAVAATREAACSPSQPAYHPFTSLPRAVRTDP
ncbi:ATP-binding protein [Streptomyces albus]|uniref:ATP-binding protein n=1 Tax=Streptomyces albus TaxID=1888 RepID=UPI00099B9FFC|nr:ATP-binding protein [Streptomyces albus]